jgi:hypothetical protein
MPDYFSLASVTIPRPTHRGRLLLSSDRTWTIGYECSVMDSDYSPRNISCPEPAHLLDDLRDAWSWYIHDAIGEWFVPDHQESAAGWTLRAARLRLIVHTNFLLSRSGPIMHRRPNHLFFQVVTLDLDRPHNECAGWEFITFRRALSAVVAEHAAETDSDWTFAYQETCVENKFIVLGGTDEADAVEEDE